jgi:hypothetical protein
VVIISFGDYDYVCELGRLITQQVLESYDAKLAESRDKKT